MSTRLLTHFPVHNFLMGLFSLIYHASNLYPTQLLDFVGMFFVTCFLYASSRMRRRHLHRARARYLLPESSKKKFTNPKVIQQSSLAGGGLHRSTVYDVGEYSDGGEDCKMFYKDFLLAFAASCVPLHPFYLNKIPFQSLVFLHVVAVIMFELLYIRPIEAEVFALLKRREDEPTPRKNKRATIDDIFPMKMFFIALAFLVLAAIFSLSDVKRWLCDQAPDSTALFRSDNHYIQGHACWHVFSSIGVFFIWRHLASRAL